MISRAGNRLLYAALGALVAIILVVDLFFLPLGIPAWALYLVPLNVCLLSWRPAAPLVVAALTAGLNAAGYFLKPLPLDPEVLLTAQINRTFGFVTLIVMGVTIRQFVVAKIKSAEQSWVETGLNQLVARLQGEQAIDELGRNGLSSLARYLDAQVGAMYVRQETGDLERCGSYARGVVQQGSEVVRPGEGLVGQTALDGKAMVVRDLPDGYVDVRSGVGAAKPRTLVLVPTTVDGVVNGVLEVGFLAEPGERVRRLLDEAALSLGTAFRSARYRQRQIELLAETQQQAEELKAQQEALKASNDEMHATNEELRSANDALDEQGGALARTAAEAERASRYKSEFLANMSHELRTPLNSLLILAKLLADNGKGNLTPEQTKFASTIYGAGNDLLALINDILDLSKIEAGKIELQVEPILIAGLLEDLRRRFAPLAAEKRLELNLRAEPGCPATIETDRQRLQQVLTNLLSNALKFTERGTVDVKVTPAEGRRVAFAVTDTGIGIALEHQEAVFEAFRQADGTTNRKFGGTGLGLSISRELATLLGGELHLASALGAGSTFTLSIPRRLPHTGTKAAPTQPVEASTQDARAARRPNAHRGRSVLVVEDDPVQRDANAALLKKSGASVVAVASGEHAEAELRRASFDCVILDLLLPDMTGLELLERSSKSNGRALPPVIVHTARSLTPDEEQRLRHLARSVIVKAPSAPERLLDEVTRLLAQAPLEPAARAQLRTRVQEAVFQGRRVLLVEDDIRNVFALTSLLEPRGLAVDVARSGTEALARLERPPNIDLVLMDVMLPEIDGLEATRRIRVGAHRPDIPVITLTAKAMPDDRDRSLAAGANDHLTKPIDGDKLLAVMRTWLPQ
ncbi:MAG: response regulator [Deltaproteobacteria bacterium]|nr:response regulator [Deltaproteobacteria bacterium]